MSTGQPRISPPRVPSATQYGEREDAEEDTDGAGTAVLHGEAVLADVVGDHRQVVPDGNGLATA